MAKTNFLELSFKMNELSKDMETMYQKVIGTSDMRLRTAYQKDIEKLEKEFFAIKHFMELSETNFGMAELETYSKITPLEILDKKKKI